MDFKNYVSITEDFPKKGISFKDISPLLADKDALHSAVDSLCQLAKKYDADYIIGPESRGFILGVPVAYQLGLGFVMARKPGKLPGDLASISYGLEYGKDALYVEKKLLVPNKRYIVVDDLMATGGTASAIVKLLKQYNCVPAAVLCAIELTDFKGYKDFAPVPFECLIKYPR